MSPERISRDAALERIRHHIRDNPPDAFEVGLMDGLGLVCAQDLFAAHATPAEARSNVDGYALASGESVQATSDSPVSLPLSGLLRPSTPAPVEALAPGHAVTILTGGPLPPGADCVLPNEEAESDGQRVRLFRPLSPREHVRAPGSDLKAGTRLVRRGEELTPTVLAALAVSGVQRAVAFRPPRSLVLALGNELSGLDETPGPGCMPADNLLLAAGMLRLRNVPEVVAEPCANSLEAIAGRLADREFQCIVTTGGTGPGTRDFIRQAARQAGFKPLFDALSLTPGKSMFAATRGRTLLFALPGTPWAVFALLHALVLPAVCWLRGRTLPVPGPVLARPASSLKPAQLGWERLVPCSISALGAELQAQPLVDRSREARLDMLQAQGLLLVSDKVEPGDLLPMIPIWETRRGHRPD